MHKIYLDNAGTTQVRPEVMEAMLPYFMEDYGNPSSLYEMAEAARNAVSRAREQVADVINAHPGEIIFTSGGTEADNAAVKGAAFALRESGKHIVISAIEHSAVKYAARQLERWGWELSIVGVDSNGKINPEDVLNSVRPDTTLVSVMMVNNEIGTIQDIATISRMIRDRSGNRQLLIHTDAIQAAGKLKIDVTELGVDMLSLSGHKVYGPKGIGALYLKRGTPFEPLLTGGGQERQRRSGTENVPGIVALGLAIELADAEREESHKHFKKLHTKLVSGIRELYPPAIFNGALDEDGVPSIVNVSFVGTTGETLLIGLDFAGVCASSGSACSSASLDPSDVLLAIGLDADTAISSIRFSFGRTTTEQQIDELLQRLEEILQQIGLLNTPVADG